MRNHQCQGNSRIEMGAAYRSSNEYTRENTDSPAEADNYPAAVVPFGLAQEDV